MCVGRNLRGQTTENATRNPTTTRLPVPFVVDILIEGKACYVTGLSTKYLKWGQWWRDLHPLNHPIVLQSNHEVTVPSLSTVRPLNLMYYQRAVFQKWYAGSLDSRPQPSKSTCRLVLYWETLKLEKYGTTSPARITPDSSRRHTSSEQKKTWRGS